MQWLLKKIVGTKNQRDVKKMQPLVDRINALGQRLGVTIEHYVISSGLKEIIDHNLGGRAKTM